MDKPQIIAHAQKSVNYTLFDCKWIPCSAKFVVLGDTPRGTGILQVYEISHAEVKQVHQAEAGKGFKCCTFGASSLQDRHLVTGGSDGHLNIWNLDATEMPIYSVKAHKEIINCIDGVGGMGIGEGAPEIVTGSRDGCVKVWDPRQKEPVANMEPEEGETKRDCWAVAFGNAYNMHDRYVCAGYDNGDVRLFDLRTMSLRWETNLKSGVVGLEFDRKDIQMNKLVATCLDNKFHLFDMRTQHPTRGFASLSEKAHKSCTIWGAKHLPQNRDVFMTLGGNGTLNLWQYSYPSNRVTTDSDEKPMGVAGTVKQLQNVALSGQPIKGFDWSPDKLGLAVCTSFDQVFRVLFTTRLNTL